MPDHVGPWDRTVDAAFAAVLDADDRERRDRLRSLESEDPVLADEVRTLLRYAEESGDTFEADLASLPSTLLGELSHALEDGELAPGTPVGPYRVVRTIGRGGWGTLYLAERQGDFRKQVALKLLRRGLDTADVLRRFQAERQILASLEHPHIARLLDGGSTPDGRPYLVLPYVDGQPITHHCRDRQAPLEERLRLFLQLCDAVQYAHRRLVVHRDLKPGNVLVDGEGNVFLLDFGIAKLLSGEGEAAHRTRTGIRLFTPEYAAPEQILGAPATTATDVYQLSHLLYQLLTGRSPHGDGDRSLAEGKRTLQKGDPVRPSRAVGSAPPAPGLPTPIAGRRLRGDLDTILLKGLKQNPDERYASVEALAEDIRAFLMGRPVKARPDGALYRLRKLIRRNPSASAAVLLLTLGGAGYLTTVNQHAAELAIERDRAQAQSRTAEEVTQFLTGLFALPGEPMGDTTTVRTVLERGVERAETELPGDPPLQASILSVMAQSYLSLGTPGEALPLAERALAVEGGFDNDPDGRIRALDRLGAALGMTGRHEESIETHERALEITREVHGERSLTFARGLNALALAHQRAGLGEEAEAGFRRSLELRRALLAEDPETHPAVLLAQPLSNLGNLLMGLGRVAESIPHLEEAVALMEPLPEQDRVRGVTLNVLGMARQRAGDLEGSEAALRASVELRRRTLGGRHPDLAISLQNLSVLLRNTGRFDEAEETVLESLEIRRDVYGDHPLVDLSLNTLGNLYREAGRTEEAVAVLGDVLERRLDRYGENTMVVVVSRNNLARALQDRGQMDEAEALLDAANETLVAGGAAGTAVHLTVRNNLGRLYLEQGETRRAREILTSTLEAREALLGPTHQDTEITRDLLARVPDGSES